MAAGTQRPAAKAQGQTQPPAAAVTAAFEDTVQRFCCEQGLFAPHSRVIAAVSGGADSMALLLFLVRRAGSLGLTVEAVHIDHGIRGAASAADAEFVAGFCAAHGVPLHRFSAAEAGIPVPDHPSEDWARRLRYGFFAQLLAGIGAEDPAAPAEAAGFGAPGGEPAGARPPVCIATAHTKNDQAETLLFRLARGAGLRGAGGIRPVRGPYVRPLLAVTRAEVECYCAALGLPWVQDATNLTDQYARGRLRAGALPALGAVNGAAVEHLAGFCARMQRLDGYFAAKGETLLQAAALPAGQTGPDKTGIPPAVPAPEETAPPAPPVLAAWALAPLQAALGQEEPVLEAALLLLLERHLPACPPGERTISLLKTLIARGRGAVQLTADIALLAGRGSLRLCAVHNVSGERGGKSGDSAARENPAERPKPLQKE